MSARTKERPSFRCRVESGRLVAADPYAAEAIDRYEGKEVEVAIFRQKNRRETGLYWHVLGRLTEASDVAPDAQTLSKMFLREFGYVERWRTMNGEETIETRSLSDFDEVEFRSYLTRVLDYIAAELLPGIDREALSEGEFAWREAA